MYKPPLLPLSETMIHWEKKTEPFLGKAPLIGTAQLPKFPVIALSTALEYDCYSKDDHNTPIQDLLLSSVNIELGRTNFI